MAWEVVPQDILAARITMSHTGASAAPVASGALELLLALLVTALCGFGEARCVFAHGVPCAPRAKWPAALAPGCGARITAALAATLAREAVPIYVPAAQAPPQHLSPAAHSKLVPCEFLQCTPCRLTFW